VVVGMLTMQMKIAWYSFIPPEPAACPTPYVRSGPIIAELLLAICQYVVLYD
jgi:hypothetical protein